MCFVELNICIFLVFDLFSHIYFFASPLPERQLAEAHSSPRLEVFWATCFIFVAGIFYTLGNAVCVYTSSFTSMNNQSTTGTIVTYCRAEYLWRHMYYFLTALLWQLIDCFVFHAIRLPLVSHWRQRWVSPFNPPLCGDSFGTSVFPTLIKFCYHSNLTQGLVLSALLATTTVVFTVLQTIRKYNYRVFPGILIFQFFSCKFKNLDRNILPSSKTFIPFVTYYLLFIFFVSLCCVQ
jgi:hypothetical protein